MVNSFLTMVDSGLQCDIIVGWTADTTMPNNVPNGAIKVDSGAKCDIIEVMDDEKMGEFNIKKLYKKVDFSCI